MGRRPNMLHECHLQSSFDFVQGTC